MSTLVPRPTLHAANAVVAMALHTLIEAALVGAADDDYYSASSANCDLQLPFLRRVNALAITTSTVGCVALGMCSLAVMHIVAHNRHSRSLPTRLVLGMLLSNVVYATTDLIPDDLHDVSGAHCGDNTVGPVPKDIVAGCLPMAVMFLGVYGTTMYELMMVLLSTHALHTGAGNIPWHREVRRQCLQCAPTHHTFESVCAYRRGSSLPGLARLILPTAACI